MDHAETAQLYDMYAQDVFRLALSYLRNRQDAEDICQNVFLRLLNSNTLLMRGKEKAWLLKCTANACKNLLNTFGRKNTQELDESILFEDKMEQELWTVLGSLPPKLRACIHLYYYEGYSQAEIADILHISRTAVQTRMSRAREKLRKELLWYEDE